MLEKNFQAKIVKRLKSMGAIVIKYEQNATTIQGFPDLLFFKGPFYGALEVKKSKGARFQPLQKEWLAKLDEMSYARAIYPENFEEIMGEIKEYFGE